MISLSKYLPCKLRRPTCRVISFADTFPDIACVSIATAWGNPDIDAVVFDVIVYETYQITSEHILLWLMT